MNPADNRMGRGGTIRGRLAQILAVPLVAVLILLVLTVVAQARTYQSAAGTSRSVVVALSVQDVIHQLQRERGLTNGLLSGEVGYRSDVDAQRARVEQARAALDRLVADEEPPGGAEFRSTLGLLNGLTGLRERVDASTADRAATFDSYTERITALSSLELGLDQAADPELRRGIAALRALGEAKEAAARERGFMNGVFAAGRFSGKDYAQFVTVRTTKLNALAEFERHATAGQRARLDMAQRTPAAVVALRYEQTALGAADGRALGLAARPWWDAMTTVVDGLRGTQQAVGDDIARRAGDLRRDALTRLAVLLGIVILSVLGEVVLLFAAVRSIIRPLAALAREADDVAFNRLPEAVSQVHASDEEPAPQPVRVQPRAGREIRSVAAALDRVQSAAVALASEQAVLRRNTIESLANLGRRNQNLIRRQLGFISELERQEAEPAALASLFELDHLATRMRRTAESLLVLVGEASPRRWSTPVPVADVVRGAIAEVEEYRRVTLCRLDEAYVAGSLAADLTHMLAELVENGLAFSPPDFNVEIYGRQAAGEYRLAIVDHGVGMVDKELDRANARLRGEDRFLVAPTRHLGHYVVGRLAEELSIGVSLVPSPVTGVTARLVLPSALLDVARSGLSDQAAAVSASPAGSTTGPVAAAAPVTPAVAAPSGTGDWRRPPVVEYVPWPAFDAAAGKTVSATAAVPTAAATAADSVQRTANGLARRVPRARGTVTPAPAESPTWDSRPAAIDRPPEDVRTMLSTFRAGTRRAVQDPASVPGEMVNQSSRPAITANINSNYGDGSTLRGEPS
ncbi:sensor histidine kinase [Micromonospora purpureochromogenes]|uniref:sensor histidine kinase n=1 Tax=Micromonospora purpureochromogenes TaxID=47872 RepID=UPI0028052B07|nr:nitrate- and nitrite sensing domain-containing protein [Micromonospora purpureochromogenes]